MDAFVIDIDDPRRDDVRAVLERHLAFARAATPAEYVHALDVDGLLDPAITFFTVRSGGRVLGVGALKALEPDHYELKSMHTVEEARRRGVARALVEHLVAVAAGRGATRVSLETGTTEEFEAAQRVYASAGFVPCGPFGSYSESPRNLFMTRELRAGEGSV